MLIVDQANNTTAGFILPVRTRSRKYSFCRGDLTARLHLPQESFLDTVRTTSR